MHGGGSQCDDCHRFLTTDKGLNARHKKNCKKGSGGLRLVLCDFEGRHECYYGCTPAFGTWLLLAKHLRDMHDAD